MFWSPHPDEVWDPYEPDRLVKLAMACRALLTYEEELLWKVIEDDPRFWEPDRAPNFKRIRESWEEISKLAEHQERRLSGPMSDDK